MVIYISLAAVFIWVLILTLIVFSIRKHYFNLISRTKKQKIDEILDNMLKEDESLRKGVESIKKEVAEIMHQSRFHLQKTGLVRFNPFERMAGEQSFVISFLNQENTGILVNFIYTHDGLRVYTKKIVKGKGEGISLSQEEEKAIKESR